LVENNDGPLQEEYHGLNVSYPDFFNGTIGTCFGQYLTDLTDISVLGGFVLQDNWPAANNTQNTTEAMVYVPEVSSTPAGGNSFRES
jgi:hypothetical protein